MAGEAAGALDLIAPLLPVYERVFGSEHLETLKARADVARSTGEAGDWAGARNQFVALLLVEERALSSGLQPHAAHRNLRSETITASLPSGLTSTSLAFEFSLGPTTP